MSRDEVEPDDGLPVRVGVGFGVGVTVNGSGAGGRARRGGDGERAALRAGRHDRPDLRVAHDLVEGRVAVEGDRGRGARSPCR